LLQGIARELAVARATPTSGLEAAKAIFRAPAPTGDDAAPAADPFGKAERWAVKTTGDGTPADVDEVEMRARLSTLLRVPIYVAWGAYLKPVRGEYTRQWNLMVRSAPGTDPAILWQKPAGTIWQFYGMHLDPFLDALTYGPKVRYTKGLPVSSGLAVLFK